jgi:putative phosphotransacetylase
MQVEIEYSNRHIHISSEVLEQLFGSGYNLTSQKKLSQAEDFAAQETVTLMGPKGKIENVRIIGPCREKTQIEILKSDNFTLGIDAPIKLSGDLDGTPGIKIVSSLNEVNLEEGVIIAKRHLHIPPTEAQKNHLKNGQKIQIETKGNRGVIFKEIIVRVKEGYQTKLHIDLEEANAAGIDQDDKGKII